MDKLQKLIAQTIVILVGLAIIIVLVGANYKLFEYFFKLK